MDEFKVWVDPNKVSYIGKLKPGTNADVMRDVWAFEVIVEGNMLELVYGAKVEAMEARDYFRRYKLESCKHEPQGS